MESAGRCGHAIFALLIAVISLIGVGALLLATREAPGTTTDSVTYLITADAMRHGDVMRQRNTSPTQFPPLYSAAIAIASPLASSPQNAARWLNAIFFAGSIALVAAIVRAAGASRAIAVAAAAMIAFSSNVLQLFAMVLSEGMFIFFTLLTIYLLSLAIQCESRGRKHWLIFIGAALACAAAFGTRFAGASMIGATAIVLLCDRHTRWPMRLVTIVSFTLIASSIALLWIAKYAPHDHAVGNRVISFAAHFPRAQAYRTAATTMTGWFATDWKTKPSRFGAIVLASLGLAGILGVVQAMRRSIRESPHHGPITIYLLILSAISYSVLILITLLYVDAYTPLDRRILAPLYILFVAFVAASTSSIQVRPKTEWLRYAAGLAGVALIALQANRARHWVHDAPDRWLGYSNRQWIHSDLIRFVDLLQAGTLIYSNAEDPIYLRTGKLINSLPGKFDASSLKKDKRYAKTIAALRNHLRARNGYLIYFRAVKRSYQATEDELRQELRLQRVAKSKEGFVLHAVSRPATASTTTTTR